MRGPEGAWHSSVETGGDVAALVAFDLVEDSMNKYGEPTIQCHKGRNVSPRQVQRRRLACAGQYRVVADRSRPDSFSDTTALCDP